MLDLKKAFDRRKNYQTKPTSTPESPQNERL